MKLSDLITECKCDIFSNISNNNLVSNTGEWAYYSSVRLNGPIAVGWLSTDDIFLINGDGIFVYDICQKAMVFEDYKTPFQGNISDDNLTYFFKDRNEAVNLFGLRGGGGNLLTKDSQWKLELISISWNVKVPQVNNWKTRVSNYIELKQNLYEGYKYIGFSKSEIYFLIMGDGGVDIYKRN